MKTDRWLILAIFTLIFGPSLIIPTIYNACTATGDELPADIGSRAGPVFDCRVPLFTTDSYIPDRTVSAHLDKGITYDDYRAVLRDPTVRHFSYLDSYGPLSTLNDNLPDTFARAVTDQLAECESTCGREYTDYQKAVFANSIVRTGVTYRYDSELYGVKDYVASPLEVLYLERGDCEDSAILFMALLKVVGIEGAFVTFESHVAVGARVDGRGWQIDGLTVFECTEGTVTYGPVGPAGLFRGDVERISYPRCSVLDKAIHGYFSYCALVHRLIPVRE